MPYVKQKWDMGKIVSDKKDIGFKRTVSRERNNIHVSIQIETEDSSERELMVKEAKKAIHKWNRSHGNKISYEITAHGKCNR